MLANSLNNSDFTQRLTMKCTAFVLSILFLYANFCCVYSGYLEAITESNVDQSMYQKYFEMDKNLKGLVNSGVKMILPYILQANERLNLSSSCRKEVPHLLTDVRRLKVSAFSFLDAIGKVSGGALTGNINMAGDYDQCLNAYISRKDGSIAFQGKYCMLHLSLKLPTEKPNVDYKRTLEELLQATKNTSEVIQLLLSLSSKFHKIPVKFGLCVPSGCSTDDIDQTLKMISEMTDVNASVAYCEVKKDTPFPTERIVAIFVFSLFGMLLIVGTFLDYYARSNGIKLRASPAKLLLCFSALKNFPKVISAKVTDSSLTCLNGIRVLSIFYIILYHRYLIKGKVYFEAHTFHYIDDFRSFFFQSITNMMTVDVFFLIGGLVNTYTRMKGKDTKRSFIQSIIHRLWRLYPTLLVSILLTYILNDFRGPMRHYFYRYVQNCDSNWWMNVLFISNYYNNEDMCLPQAWYNCADMQMFLLSLFIVPLFSRCAKKGIIFSAATMCIGLFSAVAWAYHKRVSAGINLNPNDFDEFSKLGNAYTTVSPHMAPYFFGLILGFILYAKKALKLPWVLRLIGWPIAGVAFTSMIFITKRWNSGVPYTRMESSLYFAFGRFIYASAVGWMILCCAKGYGGIINYILSLKFWIPLARLTYMMYMISPVIQIFFFGNLRVTPDSHLMITIWHHLGDIMVVCLLSLVLVVTIESPCIEMENFLCHRDYPVEKKEAENCIEAHKNNNIDEKNPKSIELDMNAKNGIDITQIKL